MDNEEEEEKPRRITNTTAALMLSFALLVDLIQALLTAAAGVGLVLNTLVSVFVGFCLWFWFKLHGVGFISDPKRFLTLMAQSLGEVIPAINNLPIFFAGALITIILTRIEDKTGIKIPTPSVKGATPNLASAKANTLKGNKVLLQRQNARSVSRPNYPNNARPTMEGSRNQMLRSGSLISKRRPGMDINSK